MTDEKEPNVEISGGQGGKGGRGGNVILSSGALGEVFDIVVKKLREGLEESGGNTLIASGVGYGQQPAGDILFNAGNLEVLRIDSEGDFFHKGEKLDHNDDVAFVLRGWLGYCLIAMNRENRVRWDGEARIAELEAKLRAAEKEELNPLGVSLAVRRVYDEWMSWAISLTDRPHFDAEMQRDFLESSLKDAAEKLDACVEETQRLKKERDARATDADTADVFANSQAKSKELDGWRDWAQRVIGVALVDAAASRFRIDKKIVDLESKLEVVTGQRDALWEQFPRATTSDANEKRAAALVDLEAQLKVVTEQRDARVKDEDVPELFAAGQRARALEDDLSAWREWACLRSGMTFCGEADSWLRVRVQDALQKSPQKMVAEASPPLALTREEILFVRDAFQAAKRSSPYGLSP